MCTCMRIKIYFRCLGSIDSSNHISCPKWIYIRHWYSLNDSQNMFYTCVRYPIITYICTLCLYACIYVWNAHIFIDICHIDVSIEYHYHVYSPYPCCTAKKFYVPIMCQASTRVGWNRTLELLLIWLADQVEIENLYESLTKVYHLLNKSNGKTASTSCINIMSINDILSII